MIKAEIRRLRIDVMCFKQFEINGTAIIVIVIIETKL